MRRSGLVLLLALWCGLASTGQAAASRITTLPELQLLMRQITSTVQQIVGLKVENPIQVGVDPQSVIDAVTRGPNHTGYHFQGTDGTHHIHVLVGQDRDRDSEILAHEYAHAWQDENCPETQDKIVVEGFAQWVAYKYLSHTGATHVAQGLFHKADPDYVTGLHVLLRWESCYGANGLLALMRKIHSQSEVAEKPPLVQADR